MANRLFTVDDAAISRARGILEHLESIAGTLDTVRAKQHSTRPRPEPMAIHCAGQLLVQDLSLYHFCPDDHNKHAKDQLSLNEVISDWKKVAKRGNCDRNAFPDVRNIDDWDVCTLRWMCSTCSEGQAFLLECVTYPFGEQSHEILVYKFDFEGQSRAVILGAFTDMDYRLWGPCYKPELNCDTIYYKGVTLERDFSYKAKPFSTMQRHDNGRKRIAPGDDVESGEWAPQRRIKKPAPPAQTIPTYPRDGTPLSIRISSRGPSLQPQDGINDRRKSVPAAIKEEESEVEFIAIRPVLHAQRRIPVVTYQLRDQAEHDRDRTAGEYKLRSEQLQHTAPHLVTSVGGQARPNSMPLQSATNTQQPGSINLRKAYDDIEAHLADQGDRTGHSALDTNDGLSTHLRWLEDAAIKNNERLFQIMRKRVNRDLKDARNCQRCEPVPRGLH